MLIVSSNPSGLIVARNALVRAGHRVVTSGVLLEGLRLVRDIAPDVLLLDDLAAQMQNFREFTRRGPKGMRVILSVPRGRGAELLAATIAEQSWPLRQVAAVIEKPYDASALLNAVRGEPPPPPSMFDEPETQETIRLLPPNAPRLAQRMEAALEHEIVLGAKERALLLRAAEQIVGKSKLEEPILSGAIGVLGIDQILQLAENAPAPTCCRFEDGDDVVEIFIVERRVVYARKRSSVPMPRVQVSVKEEIEALVYDVMGWTSGRVTILSDPLLPDEAKTSGVSLSIAPLLLEGMYRLDERRRGSTVTAVA